MAARYSLVKESEIKTIIWHDPEAGGLPTPIGIFPPPIPDELIEDMIAILNEKDAEGLYAKNTETYINSNAPVLEQDEVLGEPIVELEPITPEPSSVH